MVRFDCGPMGHAAYICAANKLKTAPIQVSHIFPATQHVMIWEIFSRTLPDTHKTESKNTKNRYAIDALGAILPILTVLILRISQNIS